MAIAEAPDDDDTEAQLRTQTPEVRVLQDIFDLLVSAFGPTTREPHRDRTRGRAHERPRPQRPRGARGSHAGVESARNLNIYL